MLDVDAEARVLRERAGFDEDDVPGSVALAARLGVTVRRVDNRLTGGADACLMRLHGAPEIFLRRGLSPERVRWAVAHELAEMRIQEIDYREEDAERQADALAAALVMPRRPYRLAAREHGVAPEELAADFVVDQTAALLRLAEVGVVDVAVVVTPERVYARSDAHEWAIPSAVEIRRAWEMPGLRTVRITDKPRRRGLVATG